MTVIRMTTIGTCSLCGGQVTTPTGWDSVTPAPVHCKDCGAVPASHGPVIPMVPGPDHDANKAPQQGWAETTGQAPRERFASPYEFDSTCLDKPHHLGG